MYRTAIVQGLSSAHGREQRRQISPANWDVISVTLKDWTVAVQGLSSLWAEFVVWADVLRKRTLYKARHVQLQVVVRTGLSE